MDTADDVTPSLERPGRHDAARPGHSGEGARSAMEQLIRQEQGRDAQAPRETGGGGSDAAGEG